MSDFRHLLLRFRALFRKAKVEEELDLEIRHHIELETEENIRKGMDPVEARRKAMMDFGAVEFHKERAREARGIRPLEIAAAELRYALRRLGRAPVFTGVSVLTLGLGIGATTAIFTLLDRVVLDPLPYPEAERLVRLKSPVPALGPAAEWESSSAQYFYYNRDATAFEGVAAYSRRAANVMVPSGPRRAHMAVVSEGALPLLGARPALGRLLDAEDDRPGAPPVAVLSHAFWTQEYGRDPDVLGRLLSLNGEPYEVVGVVDGGIELPHEPGMPSGMDTDIWVPMRLDPSGPFYNSHITPMIGRLAVGSALEGAQAEMDRLVQQLPELYPSAYSRGFIDNGGFHTRLYSLKDYIIGDLGQRLWILMGAVGLVLLIACANVVNLFLVRMEGRRRELAIRAALGAGRRAIIRPVLTESLLLAVAGGILAVPVSLYAVRVMMSMAPATLPALADIRLDGAVLIFAFGLSLVVSLALTGLSAARHRQDLAASNLAEGGTRSTAGRERQRIRAALVVSQVSLALVLIVGAGLLVESFRGLLRIDPGIDPEGALAMEIFLPGAPYDDTGPMWGFYSQVLDRVRAIPGVTEAGMSDVLPFQGGFGCTVQAFEDQEVYAHLEEAELTTCAGQEPTTPGYFEAMGIPVLQGRTFTAADNDQPERGVVVVSRAFAQQFWPGEDPIGKGVAPSGRQEGPFYRVVGVVGDVYSSSLEEDPAVAIYYPIVRIPESAGWWPNYMNLVVKTGLSDPLSVYPAIRQAVRDVDPSIPVANPLEVRNLLAESMSRVTFTLVLLGVAAGIALVLAAIGLFGVVSYLVARRRNEIGLRIALGAQSLQVEGMVVVGSLKLVVVGLGLGLAIAYGVSRVLGSLLFGVEPTDPAAYLAAGVLVTSVALLASWIPARRAAGVDPLDALRAE